MTHNNKNGVEGRLLWLGSLDIVYKNNVGLEGHSMGGWAVVFSRYNEFPEIMWGVNKATNVTSSQKMQFHIFDPLRLIISINFVPLMIFVAVVSTFAYRHTGRYLPGALICAAFVTWYMVVGQATQGG